MRRNPTPRELAALECIALDCTATTHAILQVAASGNKALVALKRLDAALEIAGLDECERLDQASN